MVSDPKYRELTIIAQDPSVRPGGRILTAKVSIPEEDLQKGPRGYRVGIVDYDMTHDVMYSPYNLKGRDKFDVDNPERLLDNQYFHAQNVYAIVMRTLARMEFALGRRIPWGFHGHQLYVAPHAMQDPNAFYSERTHGLYFGYYLQDGRVCYTCLSHDIIAHETTHAILDGLRDHFTDPSREDQAAFHEGFADIVALLSVYSLKDAVRGILEARYDAEDPPVPNVRWLKRSALFGLAEQMGEAVNPSSARREALRHYARMGPDPTLLGRPEYQEPHNRGEILVAAVMDVLARIWARRLGRSGSSRKPPLKEIVDAGERTAEHLLNICIRAIDYCPPVDLKFGDYLSAMLTADYELVPDDRKYEYRKQIRRVFRSWGIEPASKRREPGREGIWLAPAADLDYGNIHFDGLKRDPDEVFRFLWENRDVLKISGDAYIRINWVRPCVRLGPDGFVLHETVAEYVQMMDLSPRELSGFLKRMPGSPPASSSIRLYGGGTLVFDDFGHLKYHIHKDIHDTDRQSRKIGYWLGTGAFARGRSLGYRSPLSLAGRHAILHRERMLSHRGRVR